MSDLLAARSQMAVSLAFHIIFAVVGMAMPLLMVVAEGRYLRTGDKRYLVLAKRWAKGTGIMFAVGAVSGTVLSFELGLLWPQFMELAGPAVGMPFSMEGFAFFMEAIFLGIFLYGWDRVSPRVHWLSGVMVLLSGVTSGVFVVSANAWMNTPTGFTLRDGKIVDVVPWAAMFNPAFPSQALHMVVAAFEAVGFGVAGVHAWLLLRNPSDWLHQRALAIALTVGGVAAVVQPLSGDVSAVQVAENQPIKLAAMEGHWDTEKGAALKIGGWPDEQREETRFSVDIPYLLSIMAYRDPNAPVRGLKDFPPDERPPVAVVHLAFDLMVGCGVVLALVALLEAVLWRRRRPWEVPWRLKALVACTPLGFIAIEAGWTVTEVGRQPWIVQGVMRTSDAVTSMPQLRVTFLVFTLLYVVLSVVVVVLMRRLVFASLQPAEAQAAGEGHHALA
ncbi:MAG: cytochrome ubiquinol oxidase subunit I [Myxococcota bacterium]